MVMSRRMDTVNVDGVMLATPCFVEIKIVMPTTSTCVNTIGNVVSDLASRAASFKRVFTNPAAWPWVTIEQDRQVLYGVWLIGADYRNRTSFYGSYPPTYLDRVMALFPDATPDQTLHVFSGSLPPGPYMRCDLKQPAELSCSVYDLPTVAAGRTWNLVIADPPYSADDAVKYGTPPVNANRAFKALASVVPPGGFLLWLDTKWPMHSKRQWLTVGRILVQRSTMHRVRVCTIFQRA